jgi:hypothetical protein
MSCIAIQEVPYAIGFINQFAARNNIRAGSICQAHRAASAITATEKRKTPTASCSARRFACVGTNKDFSKFSKSFHNLPKEYKVLMAHFATLRYKLIAGVTDQ